MVIVKFRNRKEEIIMHEKISLEERIKFFSKFTVSFSKILNLKFYQVLVCI